MPPSSRRASTFVVARSPRARCASISNARHQSISSSRSERSAARSRPAGTRGGSFTSVSVCIAISRVHELAPPVCARQAAASARVVAGGPLAPLSPGSRASHASMNARRRAGRQFAGDQRERGRAQSGTVDRAAACQRVGEQRMDARVAALEHGERNRGERVALQVRLQKLPRAISKLGRVICNRQRHRASCSRVTATARPRAPRRHRSPLRRRASRRPRAAARAERSPRPRGSRTATTRSARGRA